MLMLSIHAAAGAGTPVMHLARIPGEAVPIIAIVFGVLGVVLLPLARALARRVDSSSAPRALPADVTERLDRIERAVKSVALEVERISEGQRFVTKLMAEHGAPALPSSQDPGSSNR